MVDIRVWRRAWTLLDARERRQAILVLGVVVVSALSAALMVGSVIPFLTVLADPQRIHSVPLFDWLYDALGFRSDYGFLVALGLGSITVIVFANLIQILRTYAAARFVQMRVHAFSSRLLKSYVAQPYELFLSQHSGDMETKILAEANEIVVRFFRPAADIVASGMTILAVLTLLLIFSPVVSMAVFIVAGAIYGGIFYVTRRLVQRLGVQRAIANKARFRIAGEALGGIKEIQLLGHETEYLKRFQAPSRDVAVAQMLVPFLGAMPQFILQATAFGGIIILCLVLLDPQGLESGAALGGILPTLGVLAFAGQRILPELGRLYAALSLLQTAGPAVDAVYADLVEGSRRAPLPAKAPPALGLRAHLNLENVTYRYPNADAAGIEDVSCAIGVGERIGVVGPTGAGKTTLANVVLGLLRPQSGRLCVDGVEISEDNLRSWRRSVGYVPQDIFLTDSSIAENIAFGVAPEAIDHARVEKVAQIARIADFIRSELPRGFETAIGERGVRLSGGQRQRIGIARALYHDADLIVFDEATSALDNLTERDVMAAIDALPGDKTVILIAHRLSTVRRCDRIAVLEQGRLVGFDTWDVLAETNPTFQRISSTLALDAVGR